MPNTFINAFAESRARIQHLAVELARRNDRLLMLRDRTVADFEAHGLTFLFFEGGPRKSAYSPNGEYILHAKLVPADLEGEDAAAWSEASTVPDYAPNATFYVDMHGKPVVLIDGGFVTTSFNDPMTGFTSYENGHRPIRPERLARAFAARFAGLSDKDGDVRNILESR